MKLCKTRPVQLPDHPEMTFLSAEWWIKDIPGLFLSRCYIPEGNSGQNAWRLILYRGSPGDDLYPAEDIYRRLEGHWFSTRREALKAVEMTMLMLELEN